MQSVAYPRGTSSLDKIRFDESIGLLDVIDSDPDFIPWKIEADHLFLSVVGF